MLPLDQLRHAKDFVSAWRGQLSRYERHISAIAMLAGFAIDNYTFGRIDRPGANVIFTAYLALATVAIAVLHFLQSRADKKLAREILAERKARKALVPADLDERQRGALAEATTPEATAVQITPALPARERAGFGRRLHAALPAATQFALGGLWSGFLVFYSRSAVFAASWPFLVMLSAILIGNEVFRRYRDRLVFAGLLLFFALYSYAIFVLPVVLGRIGPLVFALSGLAAILIFVVFLRVLKALGRERFRQVYLRLYGGALAILVTMNIFYFTDILPPLPLALADAGVYHAVKKTPAGYVVSAEPESIAAHFNLSHPTLHVAPGQALSVYSAVFAPVKLSTRIAHRWQWYNPQSRHWMTQSVVSFSISGGREGGYRGYTVKSKPRAGDWRVDIDTDDGRLIGRVAFKVDTVPSAVPAQEKTIQ